MENINPKDKNYLEKITELFAFVSSDEDGEGICAFSAVINKTPIMMTMVAADKARVDSLRKKAKEISRISNKKIKLFRFSVREELEIIDERS